MKRSCWRHGVRVRFALILVFSVGCSDDRITDASCDRCDELQIRTERSEYRPGSIVRFSITNLTSTPLLYDWCSMGLAARTTEAPFEVVYRPSHRCGPNAGLEEVLANIQSILPGETRRDSLLVKVAFQGQQRVHLWLIDSTGHVEAENPVASNIFLVFPGANSRID